MYVYIFIYVYIFVYVYVCIYIYTYIYVYIYIHVYLYKIICTRIYIFIGIIASFNKRYITLAPVAGVIGLAFQLKDPNGLLKGVRVCIHKFVYPN
jgi:hypothetical protein